MQSGTNQRWPAWAVPITSTALVIASLVAHGCMGGQMDGDAKRQVQSIEEISVEALWESREFREYLHSVEPPMTLGKFVHLGCTQIIDDDAQHRIFTQDADCPSIVLADAMGFDLVISYTDAYCTRGATLDVGWSNRLLHFTINKTDRGECEEIAIPHAKGIRLKGEASGPGQAG